jgi:glycosyltransferase involved in cell wall biosynthesis
VTRLSSQISEDIERKRGECLGVSNWSERVCLTIAIPTYNRSDSLCNLLQSVLGQASDCDEIIVSDDGSFDGTYERIHDIPGLRILRAESNRGMVANWNKCLQSASRDWICMLHDDDELQPGGIEALRSACALAGEPALVLHHYQGSRFDGALRCTVSRPCSWSVLNCPTIPSGAVVHRSIIDAVGVFDPRFAYSADQEYFARVAARFPVVVIESPRVITFRLHDANYEFTTWRKADFFAQYEALQRAIIRHAGLTEGTSSTERLIDDRIREALFYILDHAARIDDKALVRKIASEFGRYQSRLSLPQKVMIYVAARTGVRHRLTPKGLFRNIPSSRTQIER